MRTVEILVPRVCAIGQGKPMIETTHNEETGESTVRELWPSVQTFAQDKGEIVEMSDEDAADAVKAKQARYVKGKPAPAETP